MSHEYDTIIVKEKDEGVTLKLPDGSCVEVPQATISRSATLQEAIQTSDATQEVSITMPRGTLQDWLQSVEALKAAATSTGRGPCHAHHPRLLKLLKASDFMNDEDGVQQLCRQAARWLFGSQGSSLPRPDQASDQAVSEEYSAPSNNDIQEGVEQKSNCLQKKKRKRGLRALPQQLVIRILRASSLPVTKQLRLLPTCFHTTAIHANFPSIEAERSVRIRASDLEYAPFANALWPELDRITAFQAGGRKRGCFASSPQAASALGSHVAKLSGIQQLDLSRCTIGDRATALLAPHLAHLTSVQKLDLSNNNIGNLGAQSLGPHLAKLVTIQQLDLGRNDIGADGVESLGPYLAQLTCIQRLCLGGNHFGCEGGKSLGPHLAHLTTIQHLNLCNIAILRYIEIQWLGPHLAHLTSITHLDLSHNHIHPVGVKWLGPHLAQITSILKLKLGCNDIGADGAILLGPHLACLTRIQHLDLSSNDMGASNDVVPGTDSEGDTEMDGPIAPLGVTSLGRHLADIQSLQNLDLSSNSISAEDVRWLGPHLTHLTSITYLNLRDNDIGDVGVERLGPLAEIVSI